MKVNKLSLGMCELRFFILVLILVNSVPLCAQYHEIYLDNSFNRSHLFTFDPVTRDTNEHANIQNLWGDIAMGNEMNLYSCAYEYSQSGMDSTYIYKLNESNGARVIAGFP